MSSRAKRIACRPYNLHQHLNFFVANGTREILLDKDVVARQVLDALGGRENVLSNAVCMTRLRVTLAEPQSVDYETLSDVQGVLGTATRGNNGLEVVFGPRVIDGIYHAFIKLTGISAGIEDLFPMSRQETNLRVQIRTSKKEPRQPVPSSDHPLIGKDELSVLADLFGIKEKETDDAKVRKLRLIVLNGPNINMLGVTSSGATDEDAFPALLELCKQTAQDVGFARCDCFQSNHEGDLVDMIQDAYGIYDAIVINPGAYGSSAALRDALRTVSVPAIEVHLHKLNRRDTVGTACLSMKSGLGTDGYRLAIQELASHLDLI